MVSHIKNSTAYCGSIAAGNDGFAPSDSEAIHPADDVVRRASKVNRGDFKQVEAGAKAATDFEVNESTWQAIKANKKAIAWSLIISTAVVMEGYDTLLIYNFLAQQGFLNSFHDQIVDGSYNLSAPWKSALSNASNIGEILGLFVTGILQDRYGYKKTIIGALVLSVIFLFMDFFATNLAVLMAGELLCGIPWGVFQTITTAYASEIMPVALRAYLTSYVNVCWVFGQLLASGIQDALQSRQDEWAWKIPFAVQWIWPIPLIIATLLAPESPWWLVRHGRLDDAKHAIERLTTPSENSIDADQTLSMMVHTNELEIAMSAGTSYWDCFKGTDLRRTEIAAVVWTIQNFCGSTFMGFSTTFYEQAGLSDADAFDLTVAQYALGVVGTLLSWWMMAKTGRRTIYLWGNVAMLLLLLIIGFLGIAPATNTAAQWAIGSLLLAFTFLYNLTIGPVCYALVAELPSTRLRAKTIVLARNAYNVTGIITNVITAYQLTTTAWNWGAFSAFFWAGTCAVGAVWVFFRLPEPKGRTYGELDLLFEHRVPARRFAGTRVDIVEGQAFSREGSGEDREVGGEKIEVDVSEK